MYVLPFGLHLKTSDCRNACADWTDSDYAALDELTQADYIYRSPKDHIAAFLAFRFFE